MSGFQKGKITSVLSFFTLWRAYVEWKVGGGGGSKVGEQKIKLKKKKLFQFQKLFQDILLLSLLHV